MKPNHIQDAQHGTQKKLLSYDKCIYAGVALTLNGSVVLARRIETCPHSQKKVSFGGYWSIFCGSLEKGETPKQAAVREVKEETRVSINSDKLIFLGQVRGLAIFRYELEDYTNIELDYEHTEYGYFKIPEIHTSPHPVDEDVARAIQYNHFINS